MGPYPVGALGNILEGAESYWFSLGLNPGGTSSSKDQKYKELREDKKYTCVLACGN